MNAAPSHRLRREHRIRLGHEFATVYARKCTVADGVLKLFAAPNERPYARLGLSVSRRVGNAVVRNRWKRLLREAFRLSRDKLPNGIDLVIIPRPIKPDLATVTKSLVRLATQAVRRLERAGP